MIGNSTKKQNPFSLLVWGGATSVGQMLIQLAKISGAYDSIIAVASKKHEKILKRYGADSVYDYHDNDVIAKITQAYPNIKHFIGAVSDGKSLIRDVTRCASKEQSVIIQLTNFFDVGALLGIKEENIKIESTLVYLITGHDVSLRSFLKI
ncbi:hypothetical protein BZL39_M00180 [Zygosaccharomyces parabailii]|nr:hypothetical protein BZL39_M00180 [Zygosaccharomyces parabailii]CDH09583.1 uncharacterized protein ZBAI_01367 [Zygosaccharomyces bailii ISA1307]